MNTLRAYPAKITLRDIKTGDIFSDGDDVFMKIESVGSSMNAVNLSTGYGSVWSEKTYVYRVKYDGLSWMIAA